MALQQSLFAFLLMALAFLSPVVSAIQEGYVVGTIGGQEYLVKDDRRPSLYTQDFGDCMGGSSINVTRFDAAYYKDNMTILFHLGGETDLKNETIMMYIGVFAYGESRFDLTFNPCTANIKSACPILAGTPIDASGIIPISQNDVAGIPSIALSIPDFEGQAILRIFSNATRSQIGCYSGVVTNGSSFSQPAWVSSILGAFTIIAIIASFATAIYGENFPEMRKHYAHSFSVLVVFAVWQHVFFSGALSMNWPSVLVAFWSNYAWAGGMIYAEVMQNTINDFIGSNKGNTSHVGAAGTGVANPSLGGGFDVQKIYSRRVPSRIPSVLGSDEPFVDRFRQLITKREALERLMSKRDSAGNSSASSWYGHPVKPGLPLPGNFSGFSGTLAQENIPASNAFMTGFLWFLVLVAGVFASVVTFKVLLEGLSSMKMMRRNRLVYFRRHWLGYTVLTILRTLFIGFFMLMFLTLFQFSYLGSTGPVAIAAVVFLIMLLGLGGLVGYACFHIIKFGYYASEPDQLNVEKRRLLKVIPWYRLERNSNFPRSEDKTYAGSIRWWRVSPASEEKSVHDDDEYTKRFGWLAARFRRTRWWFFVVWLVYEFARACFLAGASGSPMVQVFGLLAVEFIAFVGLIILRPFEGQRLNIIAVYFLGFSKVVTVALSAAFDVRFGLPRITATAVGIVIIVVQGLLTIAVLICIILGAISSYMSVTRNRDTFHPRRLVPLRGRYLDHLDLKAKDIPRPPKDKPEPVTTPIVVEPEIPKEPYFTVSSVRRMAKVEDEDEEFMNEISGEASQLTLAKTSRDSLSGTPVGHRRSPSIRSNMSYSSLPYGARVHRASWSAQDFSEHPGPKRPRTLSNPLYGPEESRCMSGPPPLVTRISSGETVSRQLSPLSSDVSRSVTPVESPTLGDGTVNSIPRPKSTPRGRMSDGSRLQLQTLISESHIPTLAGSLNAANVTEASRRGGKKTVESGGGN
ncbi:TRP-domain-containing protein [Paraphaeosphaeria sporulosa]|uniref:TRP-domain-containing protein n=1 Tax=Paraphaeosphaeria sporulosa TaxID=1460663 RepID=A0A177CDW9_9PLEO|nr:TRP-domain-containing protein [Paraphaeosphaeria sporulosa]OAG04957.1 TRP-domain-containing protein [Paraphaeosphaeria sporulosa]